MIKLKPEINKAQITRELTEKAKANFKTAWQPETLLEGYLMGIKDLLKRCRLKANFQKTPLIQLLKCHLDDIETELIAQDKKGNLLNGAGVCLMILVDKALGTVELFEEKEINNEP